MADLKKTNESLKDAVAAISVVSATQDATIAELQEEKNQVARALQICHGKLREAEEALVDLHADLEVSAKEISLLQYNQGAGSNAEAIRQAMEDDGVGYYKGIPVLRGTKACPQTLSVLRPEQMVGLNMSK